MSRIKLYELEANKSQLKELNDTETINVIGGYDEETESTRDVIQKAMIEAVTRSDMLRNSKPTNK